MDKPRITIITTPMHNTSSDAMKIKTKYFSDDAYNMNNIGIIEIPMVLTIAERLNKYSSTYDVMSKIFPMYRSSAYFATKKNVNKKMSTTIEKLFCNTE